MQLPLHRASDVGLRIVRSAVAWSFLSAMLRTGASVFILPLILRKLSPDELGMWYVFLSLAGFAALLDLGLAPTATRAAGYLWGGAQQLTAFGLDRRPGNGSDSQPNLLGLRDLAATLQRFYLTTGIITFCLLAFGGGIWVSHKSAELTHAAQIRWAYMLWCFGVFLNFTGDLWPNLLQGLGEVRRAEQITLLSLVVYYVTAISALLAGLGIWSLVIGQILLGVTVRQIGRSIVVPKLGWTRRVKGHFRWELLQILWPNAWRVAAVSLGAYLILQANTLICSAFLGLRATASYGLSQQVITMLSSLSSTWFLVKMPLINQLRVSHCSDLIATIFAQRVRLAILTFAAGTFVILAVAPSALRLVGSHTTLLETAPLATFLLIRFLEMHHSAYASLVLSENENPFLKPALLSGIAIVLLSLILTPRFGIWGMLAASGIVQAAYNNWWPVCRAVQGLDINHTSYWRRFFSVRKRHD